MKSKTYIGITGPANIRETKEFCIDAEGGLRNKLTPAYGDDILSIRKVRGYLQSASQVIS